MKKVTFYKTMFGSANRPLKIETGTGYKKKYTISGTDNEISLIFEKRRFDWAITEEKSGMLVLQNFRTRKEAELAVTENLLQAINKKMQSVNYYITLVNIERGKIETEETRHERVCND